VAPGSWPEASELPDPPIIAATGLIVSSGAFWAADRCIRLGRNRSFIALIVVGIAALIASLAADIWSQWQTGLRPDASGYAAMVYANAALQAQIVAAVFCMALFTTFRAATGRVDARRRVAFDNLALFWLFALGQSTLGLLLTHGFPRIAAAL